MCTNCNSFFAQFSESKIANHSVGVRVLPPARRKTPRGGMCVQQTASAGFRASPERARRIRPVAQRSLSPVGKPLFFFYRTLIVM